MTLVMGAIALLVVINGFFVAAEFALVTVREVQLTGDRLPTRLARRQQGQLDQYLAACQLGITIASLALGALGEPTFARLFEPLLKSMALAHVAAVVASVLALLVMTTLHITVGEQAPKSLAIGSSAMVARFCAIPLEMFHRTFRPLVLALNGVSNGMVRAVGGTPASSHAQQASLEELRLMIGGMEVDGSLDRTDAQMLEGVFTLDEVRVADVMTPRPRVTVVRSGDTVREALQSVKGSGRSRFPVLDPDSGDLLGVVFSRELAEALLDARDGEPVDAFRHEMVVVPPNLALDAVLARLQVRHASICAVVDEYGSFAGVASIEDVLEEVVGEIWDEDDAPGGITHAVDGTVLCRGDVSLHDLEGAGVDLGEDSSGAATVAGVILSHLGRLAEEGDSVEVAGFGLSVIALDGRAIARVAIRRLPEAPAGGDGGGETD